MSQQFDAVILAGGTGSRIYPLAEGHAKALLPVAGRPLLSYQLELLHKHAFQKVIVLTNVSSETEIKAFVRENNSRYAGMEVNVCTHVDNSCTAESILSIRSQLKAADLLIISGDVILEDGGPKTSLLQTMADFHRVRDAAATILVRRMKKPEVRGRADAEFVVDERDYIGLEDNTSSGHPNAKRMVFFAPASLSDTLVLPKALLRRHPNLVLFNDLFDAHVYFLSQWVLDFMQEILKDAKTASLRNTIIPYLIKNQFNSSKVPESALKNFQSLAYSMSTSNHHFQDYLPCYSYIMEEGLCVRVNTTKSYLFANRIIASSKTTCYLPWEPLVNNNYIHPSVSIEGKATVGSDCVCQSNVKIGDKSSIKCSTIGSHCVIGNSVRITNCVVMDHVTISDGCNLTNVIVCTEAHIRANCTITNCTIGYKYFVSEKSIEPNFNKFTVRTLSF